MAFNHRKLMLDSYNETLSRFCEPYCDSNRTQDGACPTVWSVCFPLCDRTCYHPPPPPPPPPPNIPYNPPNKSSPLTLPLTISLSILVAAFALFCCYAIYKCYTGWYRSRQVSQPRSEDDDGTHDEFLDEDHGPVVDHPIWYIRTVGLNPSVISAITICKYKKDEGIVEGTDCSVCLNEFQEDETLRLLPKCNHAFHIPCIDTWLTSHTNCPLCRAGIVRSTTVSPSPELVVDDSGRAEEIHMGISENIELEDEVEEEELGVENEIKKSEVDDEFQPMRRSVSLDSSSAAMISAAIANVLHQGRSEDNSDTQLVKVNESNTTTVPKRIEVNQSLLRLMGSSSFARSLQRGPMFMKRSVSCSGKVLSSTTHGRNRNSILPP